MKKIMLFVLITFLFFGLSVNAQTKEDSLAIENYRKSLELNPSNDNAEKMLEELGTN